MRYIVQSSFEEWDFGLRQGCVLRGITPVGNLEGYRGVNDTTTFTQGDRIVFLRDSEIIAEFLVDKAINPSPHIEYPSSVQLAKLRNSPEALGLPEHMSRMVRDRQTFTLGSLIRFTDEGFKRLLGDKGSLTTETIEGIRCAAHERGFDFAIG